MGIVNQEAVKQLQLLLDEGRFLWSLLLGPWIFVDLQFIAFSCFDLFIYLLIFFILFFILYLFIFAVEEPLKNSFEVSFWVLF